MAEKTSGAAKARATPPSPPGDEQSPGSDTVIQPVTTQVHTGEEEGDTVQMLFPCPVALIEGGIMHKFARGVQKVPAALAGHWYLEHNGVARTK